MKSAFNFIHRPRNKREKKFFFIIITLYLTFYIGVKAYEDDDVAAIIENVSDDGTLRDEGIGKDEELFLNPKNSQNQKITLDPSIVNNSLVVESDGKKINSVGAERNVIVDDPSNGFIDDMCLTAMRELGYLDDAQDSISINSSTTTTGTAKGNEAALIVDILNNNYSDRNRTEFKCISSKYTINNHKFELMLVIMCIALFTILPSIFTYIIMKKTYENYVHKSNIIERYISNNNLSVLPLPTDVSTNNNNLKLYI